LWVVIGILLVLVGGLWTLQGLNVLGGSAMSGKTLWAVVGPIVAIAGAILAGYGAMSMRRREAGAGTHRTTE
jgi:hypothetical protein